MTSGVVGSDNSITLHLAAFKISCWLGLVDGVGWYGSYSREAEVVGVVVRGWFVFGLLYRIAVESRALPTTHRNPEMGLRHDDIGILDRSEFLSKACDFLQLPRRNPQIVKGSGFLSQA